MSWLDGNVNIWQASLLTIMCAFLEGKWGEVSMWTVSCSKYDSVCTSCTRPWIEPPSFF